MSLQIEVDEEVARLESPASPLYPLLEKIDRITRDKKESSLELDLVFQYGEGTWDSCAPIWVGDKSLPGDIPLSIKGKLPICTLKEELKEHGYKKVEHLYGDKLPKNIIRLILSN